MALTTEPELSEQSQYGAMLVPDRTSILGILPHVIRPARNVHGDC